CSSDLGAALAHPAGSAARERPRAERRAHPGRRGRSGARPERGRRAAHAADALRVRARAAAIPGAPRRARLRALRPHAGEHRRAGVALGAAALPAAAGVMSHGHAAVQRFYPEREDARPGAADRLVADLARRWQRTFARQAEPSPLPEPPADLARLRYVLRRDGFTDEAAGQALSAACAALGAVP